MRRFVMGLMLLLAAGWGYAQQAAMVPPPITGLLVGYRYWPEQFVQWTGSEVPYSMIELDVDDHTGKPVYDVVLTERAGEKRVHYSNVEPVAAAGRQQDGEGYVAKIEFQRADTEATGAVFTLRFALKDGTPVEWRFVQGSDVMEQGGGMTPLPQLKIPVLANREEGAVAGEGTALQVGTAVSTAEMWKEISHPPYFVAYRGALSHGATTVVLAAGAIEWKILSAPPVLAPGAVWKLSADGGRDLTIRVEKLEGSRATLAVEDGNPAWKRVVEASYIAGAWQVERMRFLPAAAGEAHGTTLQFTPALGAAPSSSLDVVIGKKNKVASATVSFAAGADGATSLTLQMKTPSWAKEKALTGTVKQSGKEIDVKWVPRS